MVTDQNGCTAFDNVIISEPSELIADIISHTDETCDGNNDGTATVNATGGLPPYTYDWSNDGTGDFDDPFAMTGLADGDYTVVVKDANGCTTSASDHWRRHGIDHQ